MLEKSNIPWYNRTNVREKGGMKMMQKVEVIALCDTCGHLRPLRIRFEGADCQLHRIGIEQVISAREVAYVGVEAIIYLCKSHDEKRERIFELRYNIRSHDWQLLRWIC